MEKHRARPLYRELATAIQAMRNCEETNNVEWVHKWAETIDNLTELLPHGSGIDSGCQIDLDKSHAEKLVIHTSFHHMNDGGFYDGWTEHTITVTPSFSGINLRISGPNRNDIKEYLYDTFDYILRADVAYHIYRPQFPDLAVQHVWEDESGEPSQCYQAFYAGVGEDRKRFWNNLKAAQDHAADLMETKFYNRA